MRSEAQGRAVSRTCNENGSEQVPAVGGGKRGGRQRDSAEGAVVVVDVHPPRTPHDHMDRINCPFADEQLDFSIGSPAKNVEYFLLYYKIMYPFRGELAKYALAHIGCDCRSPSSRFPAASENEVNPFAVRYAISYYNN
jgi:hypothetical protein